MSEEKVDLLPLVREEIPKILKLEFNESIEALHALERRTRIGKDDIANCEVCRTIASLCIDRKRWQDLSNNIAILSKRRGYSRKAITDIVDMSMAALDSISDIEVRVSVVRCLLEVTEGKIFVEVQRARLTKLMVDYLEGENKLDEAMNLLQELRLEVLTTMDEAERMKLMLHQFWLCLETHDALRSQLSAEKIKDQKLPTDELKLEFLDYLIRYHTEFTNDFMEIADAFYKTYKINNDSKALMHSIIAAILAPRSDKQLQFFTEVSQLRDLTLLPDSKMLLSIFMGRDLISYPDFDNRFGSLIEEGHKDIMRRRVIEHGLRTISKYYSRIRLERLAQLLVLSVDELEQRIIDLVFSENFYARIDRPKGIVTFKKQKKVSEVADEFSENIAKVCKLVDKANSLIEKERQCIHRTKI